MSRTTATINNWRQILVFFVVATIIGVCRPSISWANMAVTVVEEKPEEDIRFEPHRAFVSEKVKVYASPSEDAEVLGTLAQWQEVFVSEEIDDLWVKITKPEIVTQDEERPEELPVVQDQYVKKEYLSLTHPVDEAEVRLLSQLIYLEAGGVSRDEMLRVARVAMNRKETSYHEFVKLDTLEKVISYKDSYPTSWRKISSGRAPEPSDEAKLLARQYLDGTIDREEIYLDNGERLTADTLFQGSSKFCKSTIKWMNDGNKSENGEGHYYGIPKELLEED